MGNSSDKAHNESGQNSVVASRRSQGANASQNFTAARGQANNTDYSVQSPRSDVGGNRVDLRNNAASVSFCQPGPIGGSTINNRSNATGVDLSQTGPSASKFNPNTQITSTAKGYISQSKGYTGSPCDNNLANINVSSSGNNITNPIQFASASDRPTNSLKVSLGEVLPARNFQEHAGTITNISKPPSELNFLSNAGKSRVVGSAIRTTIHKENRGNLHNPYMHSDNHENLRFVEARGGFQQRGQGREERSRGRGDLWRGSGERGRGRGDRGRGERGRGGRGDRGRGERGRGERGRRGWVERGRGGERLSMGDHPRGQQFSDFTIRPDNQMEPNLNSAENNFGLTFSHPPPPLPTSSVSTHNFSNPMDHPRGQQFSDFTIRPDNQMKPNLNSAQNNFGLTFSHRPPPLPTSSVSTHNYSNPISTPVVSQPPEFHNFVHANVRGGFRGGRQFDGRNRNRNGNRNRGRGRFEGDIAQNLSTSGNLSNQNRNFSSSTLSIGSDMSNSKQKKGRRNRAGGNHRHYELGGDQNTLTLENLSKQNKSLCSSTCSIYSDLSESNSKRNKQITKQTSRNQVSEPDKKNVDKDRQSESDEDEIDFEGAVFDFSKDQLNARQSESDEDEIDFKGAVFDFSKDQSNSNNDKSNTHDFEVFTTFSSKSESQEAANSTNYNFGKTNEQADDNCSNADKLFDIGQLNMLLEKDPNELVLILNEDSNDYTELFKERLDSNVFVLVVKILYKVCCAEHSQERVDILGRASLNVFLDYLFEFITELPFNKNKDLLRLIDCFYENVIKLYETLMDFKPSACSLWLTHLVELEKSIECVQKNLGLNINNKCIRMVHSLIDDLKDTAVEAVPEDTVRNQNRKSNIKTGIYFPEPVGDFRTVPLFPRPEDVYDDQPFLYPNIVDGPYQNVDHYLDIHFKLLREDFMSPIRQALKDYKRQQQSKDKFKRIDNVRIYKRVKFLHPKTITDKMGFEICFDVDKKINRVNWEFANRFMFGSLLLFTSDNFDSFFLGTVANSNVRELEKKLVTVELVEALPNAKSILGKEFIMAESQTYFNPYYQVLKALQWFNKENFPLARYIVGVNTDTSPPGYLSPTDIYNVQTDDGNTVNFRVSSDLEWPTPDALALDQSQYNAFKAALTTDLTVIQGPPGTGKTYLGLKIAKALLANSHVWNTSKSPIFVVCFTNHALDQFLEGLLPVTSKLVRIGGKSKGSELDKFNIRDRRREYNYYKKSNTRLSRELSLNMNRVFAEVKTHQTNLQLLDDTEGIVSSKTLQMVMENDAQKQCINDDDSLMSWLLAGVSRRETSVKITITEDMGIVREESTTNPEAAANEDFRVAQTFFDAIELDSAVCAPEGTVTVHFACVLDTVRRKLQEISEQLRNKNIKRNQMLQLQTISEDLNVLLKHLTRELNQKRFVRSDVEKEQLLKQTNLYQLTSDDRWKLYHLWVNIMRNGLIVELGRKESDFRGYSFQYEQLRQADDIEILRTSHVVGTTTTIAAKFKTMFTALAPKIVIVEEAAEVLEAHVLASLPPSCQHLILIGDHKQLRPSVASDWLARQYKLDVSLFERMVRNGMACHTLRLQHRMRPEISQQLVPTIYPLLLDHDSVHGRDNIRGMNKNVFFMTHTRFEDDVVDITSKRNVLEAEVLLNLTKYLVQQGYKPSEITILATYKGQMYHMKNEIKKIDGFPKGVHITVVDNFQGEENKIILLSLVRSNPMKKIGFLEIENRVCVALSRARDGLYIVGNMDILCHSSKIWPHIRDSLRRQDAIGPWLELRCQTHEDQVTRIGCGQDFGRVSEGGCSLLCGQPLPCGHACKSMCHVSAGYHDVYKCKEPCDKILCQDGHQCPKRCHQRCEECKVAVRRNLPCGHFADVPCSFDPRLYQCESMVDVEITLCGHKVKVPCYMRYEPKCNTPCENRLNCGHSCDRTCHVDDDPEHTEFVCHKPCRENKKGCSADHPCKQICYEECKPCMELVERTLPCGHNAKVNCSADLDAVNCKRRCERTLDCGHACVKKCFQDCQPCIIKVDKTARECGHIVKAPCNQLATKQHCAGDCKVRLDCGHLCAKRCCDPCSSEDCMQIVSVGATLPCGHGRAEVPCNKRQSLDSDEDLMQYCAEPCGQPLSCKHKCSGSCSACMQGRIHQMCDEPCGNVLICGHSCKVPCREACPPCNQKCTYKCKHSKCPKICGEPCVSCKEPCDYGCEHSECGKLCGEMCDRAPCEEACAKRLECGHGCVGYCGEPCPPCYDCEAEHFEEFFMTGEETKDARWIYLEECKHTFEASGLEYWLTQKQEGEIVSKVCPRCKTPVVKTQRFMNLIKETYQDIQRVKQKCFGKMDDIRKQRLNALRKIQTVEFEVLALPVQDVRGIDRLEAIYNKLQRELPEVKMKKRNVVDAQKVKLLCFMTEFFVSLYERKRQVWNDLNEDAKHALFKKINLLTDLLTRRQQKVSEQEMKSFESEVKRIHRSCDLLFYTSSYEYKTASYFSGARTTKERADRLINSTSLYTDARDGEVKQLLVKLKEQIKSSAEISDAERAMINKAMGSNFNSSTKTGHWFKCKNGHVYCITECGGAMEEAVCPVGGCGETIGGRNHTLSADQTLAAEMDGAKYAAWSDTANMANYGNI